MKWFPWRLERRDGTGSSSYTDAVIAAALANSTGEQVTATAAATAALEAASGTVGRAFAAATVTGSGPAIERLTPACMAMIGRALIRRGEFVAWLDVVDGAVLYAPAQDHDVKGRHDPAEWRYQVTMAGPSRTTTRSGVRPESVLHVRYAQDPETPWRGIGPIQAARIAGKLSANVAQALADEAGTPRGQLLPQPKPGDDPTLDGLKADLKALRGGLLVVESMADQWGNGPSTPGVSTNWDNKRLGPAPPESVVTLLDAATREVLSACGIPPELVAGGDGTSLREAYRRLLHGTIGPLGRLVESELREKVHDSIRIGFDGLFAADVTGRARAWRSLVGNEATMDPMVAARLVGMEPDD